MSLPIAQPSPALNPFLHDMGVEFLEMANGRAKIALDLSVPPGCSLFGVIRKDGHVDSIAAATGARFSLLPPENATGNFVKVVQRVPVKILLDPGQDQDHLLRPGLSAEPTVYTK